MVSDSIWCYETAVAISRGEEFSVLKSGCWMSPFDYRAVYEFWFGHGSLSDVAYIGSRMKLWFGKNAEADREIARQFGPWLEAYRAPDFVSWKNSPAGWVSLILLLDQFPRNAFRGTPKSFAFDPYALELAKSAVASNVLARISLVESLFVLLPFEHSESLSDQEQSIRLFTSLKESAPPDLLPIAENTLDYAIRHRDIIARFGRFPHRNAILGRVSTAEEVEFLKSPGSGF